MHLFFTESLNAYFNVQICIFLTHLELNLRGAFFILQDVFFNFKIRIFLTHFEPSLWGVFSILLDAFFNFK